MGWVGLAHHEDRGHTTLAPMTFAIVLARQPVRTFGRMK
jgi:hypothetical protein